MSPNATDLAIPTHGLVSVPVKKGGPPVESQPTTIEVEGMSFFYGQSVVVGIELMLIGRHLERTGDHATNIAEDVVFVVAGETSAIKCP